MKTLLALSLVAMLAVAGCTDGVSANGGVPDPPDPNPRRPSLEHVAVQIFLAGDCGNMRQDYRFPNGEETDGGIFTGQWVTQYYAPQFLPVTISVSHLGQSIPRFGPVTITRDTVMIWRCS